MAAVVLALTLGPCHVANSEIIGLYSTGVDDDGVVLASGTIDPHYTLLSAPSGVGSDVLAQATPRFWSAPPAGSSWASVVESGGIGIPAGDYVFATEFTIQGVDPGLVVLTGSMLVDNSAEIFVNGQSTDVSVPFGFNAHQVPTDFELNRSNANFVTGTNTIELRWNNAGHGAGGIAMAIRGEVVPEPSSAGFMALIGLSGLVFERRRRRAASGTINSRVSPAADDSQASATAPV